ncbi:unnamed protein product [Rotaria sordida]|uniref:Uncharacterized protein n=1 Tax=Rotaria sordida TaxID=392033 RepID=A0A818G9S0_9BILA|nr:unnamed protein product [Rotaria sordida]CAF3486993.1 unnamed protein product [Rotaria sordida]CAF3552371.1 unnamed protein product [Rotaria sordida]CAF3649663.1 unnamed protein product [Rotaria sordida]
MVTITATKKLPQSIEQATQSANNEQRQTSALIDHHQTNDDSKHLALSDDEDLSTSNSDEEYNHNNNDHQHQHNQATWPQIDNQRYAKIKARASTAINVGDSRLWPIPYRFGKRAAMPYRFGKRAAMPYRFGKRGAAMHFRLGKKNTSL